jgi:hypothetical protein
MKKQTLTEELNRMKQMTVIMEGGWNLPDDVSDSHPYFNEPEPDDYSHWEADEHYVTLLSQHNGWHYVDWDYLFPEAADSDAVVARLKANPKDPEVNKLMDDRVREYMAQYPHFEWEYQERDGEPPDHDD